MSKIYRLIIISIMALIFAIGCSDTNSQSSGGGNITDNGSSGGNGGDGSGGDGSGSSSEIINSTMRASASQDNALLYTFFTPAAATNGASLKYSWDFDDNAVETTDNNIINHEFSKYGKSYNVTLEVSNMQTNDKENVSMIIPLPKPTIYFACSSAGLDIYCLPNISQQGIMDVEYTWNIYNSSNQQIASLNTTGSHELATYTLPLSGTYQVELIGRSEKVDGDLIYTENVEVNQSFNKGSISYSTVSSDKLQYRLRYSAGSTNGDILNYCWEIDDEINSGKCESDANYHQGTSSTYDEIMHTFPKYKKAYNIKGYVKDASGENPAVSSAIIYQDLPVVAVTVTGTGLSKKFSPVFTYKPAGNLQYVWNFGDGAQSSVESPEHTYQKSGYYTVNLEVISDKFDTSIGSIKSDDLNININEHINNVVIETSLKARDKSGEKYVITSPAESTNGALYYIWKVDGAVVSEGENIHTLEYSFPVFGKSYSVSLEVEDKTTGTKVIAEPKVITTKKPIAKIVLPPYSTPNTQVQIQAKVYFEDTGEDFVLIADNPQYEWYINGQNENQNKSSIDKFFTQTQQVPVKLNISAENIEGRLLTAESTIYINELNVECSIADDAEDMYGAIVTCSIPTNIEGSTAYYYKFTYTEYMNGVPTLVEVPATEKTHFKIKLYEEGSPRRYQTRDIDLQWYAGVKEQYQYSGIINISYEAKEPIMDEVVDVKASSYGAYILTKKGNVFYAYDTQYPLADPRYLYALNEPIKATYHGSYYFYFQAESGNIYRIKESNGKWIEENGIEKIKGVAGNLLYIVVRNDIEYLLTDNGVYMLGYYGDGTQVLNKKILGIFGSTRSISNDPGLIIFPEDGQLFIITPNGHFEEYMPEIKFKKYIKNDGTYNNYAITENNDVYSYKKISTYQDQFSKIGKIEGIDVDNMDIIYRGNRYIINGKIYHLEYTSQGQQFVLTDTFSHLEVKDVKSLAIYRNENSNTIIEEECTFILTQSGDVYVYAPMVKYGFTGLGDKNIVTVPQKIKELSKVTDLHILIDYEDLSDVYEANYLYGINKIVAETENGTYEWGMKDVNNSIIMTPIKAVTNYKVLDKSYNGLLTTDGFYYSGRLIEGIQVPPVAQNYNLYYLDIGDYDDYIYIEGKLYTLIYSYDDRSFHPIFVNQEYFESIGQ